MMHDETLMRLGAWRLERELGHALSNDGPVATVGLFRVAACFFKRSKTEDRRAGPFIRPFFFFDQCMFQTLKAASKAGSFSRPFTFVLRGVGPVVTILRAINLLLHTFPAFIAQSDSHMSSLPSQKEDVDKVTHLIEETSLSLNYSRNGSHWQTLRELGLALARLYRFKKFGDLEDIDITIKYLRSLHNCPLEAFSVSRHAVTTSLVEMLAARVMGDSGDSSEDIDEILFFCRGLTASPGYLISALQALTRAVLDAYSRDKQIQSFDQAIGCFKEVLKTRSPDLHRVSLDLANLLAVRFLVLHIDNDYEEAKVLLDRVTYSLSPGDSPCPCFFEASALTTALGHARSIVNSNVEDFEKAISRCRSFLKHSPLFGDPLHPVITELLVSNVEQASKDFTPPQDGQVAHLEVDFLPSSTQLGIFVDGFDGCDIVPAPLPTSLEEEIDRLRRLYSEADLMTERQRKHLKDLVQLFHSKIFLTDDTTFIEEANMYNRRLIATTLPTDKSKLIHLSAFGDFLYIAFDRTKRVEYLDESILLHREVHGLKSAQLTIFSIIQRLIWSLSIRWRLFRRGQDLDEVMCLFESYVRSAYATIPNRFEFACRWAHAARISRHHSLQTAYENVMSLMQYSLVFAPTLPIQHNRLFEKRLLYETLPLNFASHHIRNGQLERAVETLEQGRALLWSEMRGFHTSTDRLRAADPALAERLAAINQELEILTTSASSNESVGMNGEIAGDEWTAKFSDLMAKQQELLKKRDALILVVRALPGLNNFLLPLPFDTLRSAASHGPIIIINHCEWRSDIFIVLRDSPPSHIPTPYDFFDRAKRLKNELLNSREKHGLDSDHHENALSHVLMALYELVGRPVIERLNRLGIAEQSRVWWCPISVFGYLPLHAMGPIPSDSGDQRYFSDVYISSYTPTLSALIASRENDTQASALLTLLVAKPSPSPPGAWPDAQVVHDLDLHVPSPSPPGAWPDAQVVHDLDLHVTNPSLGITPPTTVLDGLQHHQFACVTHRGELKAGKPFEAAMWLPNGRCLTLLDIVRSRHPTGKSALLPGLHRAEPTDGNLPDEAFHLSAAVQLYGLRSVIGTTWGISEDGRDLAENVHRSMLLGKEDVEPYYERAAKALQNAVQQMRHGLRLARWVNYVHYGA
jgi:tetratricopeptide (TPR) repeat protein